jgi:hypothetical protein
VNNTENIFEELNKMRNLIVAKAGTVISEQANLGADVGTIMRELDKFNSDESKIVNIVKKYKDKGSFKSFIDQYKTISGKDFGSDVFRAIQPYNDKTEWNDLSNHLKSLGITLGTATTNRGNSSSATFTGLDGATKTGNSRQKNTNIIYCSVKNGIIVNPSSMHNGKKWDEYVKTYKLTADEIAKAKASCGSKGGVKTNTGTKTTGGGSNSLGEYSKQVQTSLGITPTGQLSDTDLDAILKRLEGGEISGEVSQGTNPIPMDANGQPDLDKILASL